MRPVEPTRAEPFEKFNARSVTKPFRGVSHALIAGQAFAFPEFTTTTAPFPLSRVRRKLHRRGANLVCREHSGDGRGRFGNDEREVAFLPLFEPLPVPSFLMSQKTPPARSFWRDDKSGNFFE